jgi:hypothetical protein
MKKIDVGQAIAILANIGVIAGIAFLALEVRNSRIATLAQTQDSIADGFITLNMATISNPEIGATFQKGLYQPEELSEMEAIRFSMHMRALFNQFRRIFQLYEAGLIDESSWALYATEAFTFLSSPGGQRHFAVNELEERFRAAILQYEDSAQNVDLLLGR